MLGRTYPPIRSDSAGAAKSREQKRQAEIETEERNRVIPVFMFQGYGFRPQYRVSRGDYLEGPLCPKSDVKGEFCFTELSGASENTSVSCDVCGFTGELPQPLQRFREIAHKKYEGHQRFVESGENIETLDVPYTAIKAENKDQTREVKIKWSQKDGRNMAVIYFLDNSQDGEKAQVFVDMDRQELRHDASDIDPKRILTKITAEFADVKSEITYTKDTE